MLRFGERIENSLSVVAHSLTHSAGSCGAAAMCEGPCEGLGAKETSALTDLNSFSVLVTLDTSLRLSGL